MSSLVSLVTALIASAGRDGAPPVPAPAPSPQDAPAAPVVYPQWKGALSLGATWTDGNTETTTLNGNFNAERRGEKDRWTFDAFTNYGETRIKDSVGSTTNTNNSGGGAKYDYFVSKKFYAFCNASAKVDHVADLDLRYIAGAGVGYQWTETEKTKWGTEAGFSYVDEDFGDDNFDADFLAARLASNLSYQISQSAAFEQVAEVLPSLDDSEDLIAKVDNRLKLKITGKWIAQIQYVLDFDGSVPPGNDEADHRVVLGLGWSFGS